MSFLNVLKSHWSLFSMQGVNPWIEVDGGVGPKNAYKVPNIWSSQLCLSWCIYIICESVFKYFLLMALMNGLKHGLNIDPCLDLPLNSLLELSQLHSKTTASFLSGAFSAGGSGKTSIGAKRHKVFTFVGRWAFYEWFFLKSKCVSYILNFNYKLKNIELCLLMISWNPIFCLDEKISLNFLYEIFFMHIFSNIEENYPICFINFH